MVLAVIMVLVFAPGLSWLMFGSMAVVTIILALSLRGFSEQTYAMLYLET